MEKIGWFSRLLNRQPSHAKAQRVAGGVGVAVVLMMTGAVSAQLPMPSTTPVVPEGYAVHQSVDLGGHMVGLTGSGSMYDTLVNLQSGPRMLGETYEMRALPTNKHALVDNLQIMSSGFGGDPNNFAKLDATKGKYFEFNGQFRRDRQYFDYDLLGNPNIVPGSSIPIGPSASPTGSLAWPQVNDSPVMFNTVRRMTDTELTLFPLSRVTYRFGYSKNTFEGPSLSPSYTIAKYDALLEQYQRHNSDDYMGAIDWKPVQGTKFTFEERVNRYKADSYFTLNPNGFLVQEADGTPAYLGNWDSQTPYGVAACNKTSMVNSSTVLYAPQTPGGKPVIDPACAVVTSYMRTQPTRITTPTEIFRFQSTSIKSVSMNGDFRYTLASMNLPRYSESMQGLNGSIRSTTDIGYAKAHRAVVAADYGFVWEMNNAFSLSDQVTYSSVHQPGYSNLPVPTALSTPGTAGSQTITYSGKLTQGVGSLPHGNTGSLAEGYFGQEFLTNNLTLGWVATSRANFSLTYRASHHQIGEGIPHTGPATTSTDPASGSVEINENGGIFNAVLRPTSQWDINGSAEVLYANNAFTPVGPRQMKHYRVHTAFRPKPWATLNAAFNDLERHNNTNNAQDVVAAGDEPWEGPLDHVDHTRIISVGGVLAPNEHYSLDFNYAYNDVYSATNICYNNGATSTLPGTASASSTGVANVCPGIYARGSTTILADWHGRDFMDAPTQYGSVALAMTPTKAIHSDIGYRVSSVNGSRFYNDARDVAGSLVSTYESPYVNFAWTSRPGLIWKAEYNFYGYGEGGPSGPQSCSTSTTLTSAVVPCSSLPYPTGLTEPSSGLTAARNFHANNVTLGVHYEF